MHHLQAMLQLDTSNPPGNESLMAHYLADVLRCEGLEPIVLEKTPGRANLIARLKGCGQAAPLLLMGHTDVVPAEPEAWSHPPFGGVIDDGFLWGRGALDMKCMVAYELVVMLYLKRIGVELARDVIFAATADEEGFGGDRCGMAFVAQEYPELVQAEFALNELGGSTVWLGGLPVYPIIVGEKAACQLVVRAVGESGHASEPTPNSATGKLCVALERLDRLGLPAHRSKMSQTAVEKIGAAFAPRGLGWLGKNLGRMLLSDFALGRSRQYPAFQQIYGVTHNTAVPTFLQAGIKFNVIPAQAEAVLNGRYLPGVEVEEFVSEVRAALGAGVSVELDGYSMPLEFPYETRLFDTIRTTLEALHPGSVAIPWIMSGGTDAGHVARLGTIVYGFSPVQFEPGFDWRRLVHGVDERIPLNGISFGITAFWEVVKSFVSIG